MTATFAEDLKIKNLYPIKLLLFLQAAGKRSFLAFQFCKFILASYENQLILNFKFL